MGNYCCTKKWTKEQWLEFYQPRLEHVEVMLTTPRGKYETLWEILTEMGGKPLYLSYKEQKAIADDFKRRHPFDDSVWSRRQFQDKDGKWYYAQSFGGGPYQREDEMEVDSVPRLK